MRRLVALFVLVACGPSAAERRAACETRVVALEARLAELRDAPPTRAGAPGFEPARGDGADAAGLYPIATIGLAGRIFLDGRALDAEGLARDVDTLRRNWGILHPRERYTAALHVWADRRLSLDDVRLATAFVSPPPELWLLAESSAPTLPPPPCPAGRAELCRAIADAPRGSARSEVLAPAWRAAIGDCWELQALSASVASADMSARAEQMRSGVPEALRACQCVGGGLDVEAVVYLTDVVLGLSEPRVAMRRLGPPAETDAVTTVEALFSSAWPTLEGRLAECEARIAAFPARVASIVGPPGPRATVADFHAAVVPGTLGRAPSIEPRPVLVVGRDGSLELDGVPASTATDVAEWLLHRSRTDQGRTRLPYTFEVHVRADRAVTLGTIRALLSEADPYHRVTLLADAPDLAIAPPECPRWLEMTCAGIDAERGPARDEAIEAAWAEATRGCTALVELHGSLAEAHARRTEVLEALVGCGCSGVADGAAVLYLNELRLGADELPARAVDVPAEADGSLTVEAFLARDG